MTEPGHGLLPEQVDVPGRPELQLRLWQVEDAPALTELISASIEHLRPFMPWVSREPLSAGERATMIAESLAEHAQGGDAFYAIWLGDHPVGAVGAHHRIGPSGLELGYWISPDVEGKGIVTEVVRVLTDALLALPGNTHIEIRMDEGNPRSAAVPRRCGYRLVAHEERTAEAPAETGRGLVWRFGADPVS